jgi:hypothetical protein
MTGASGEARRDHRRSEVQDRDAMAISAMPGSDASS